MSCLMVKFSHISCSLHRLVSQSHSSIPAAISARGRQAGPHPKCHLMMVPLTRNRSPQFHRRFIPWLSARAQMLKMMKNLVVLMLTTAPCIKKMLLAGSNCWHWLALQVESLISQLHAGRTELHVLATRNPAETNTAARFQRQILGKSTSLPVCTYTPEGPRSLTNLLKTYSIK